MKDDHDRSSARCLPCIGPVYPDFVDLLRILAQILDMPENMAFAILAHEVAQIGSKTHVRDSGLVISPLFDWEALEEDESFAVDELFPNGVKPL